nr:class I SAM-dependent methyltransferase [Thalassococcus arenae]
MSDRTQAIYDRQAVHYDARRSRTLFERGWLERALVDVPRGGTVLDLGCGAGEPIGRFLVESGYAVTGVDFSAPMLRLFAERFPQSRVIRADMNALDLPERFDAIIGWGSFFHLTQDQQRRTLPRLVQHLGSGGRLLLTVGPSAGETTGRVGDETVFHASLDAAEYAAILEACGCGLVTHVADDPQCNGHSLLLARKTG